MKLLSECTLEQLKQQRKKLIETSDRQWKTTEYYKLRMRYINNCIVSLKGVYQKAEKVQFCNCNINSLSEILTGKCSTCHRAIDPNLKFTI